MVAKPSRAVQALVDLFFDLYPAEAAKQLEKLPVEEIVRLLQAAPVGRAARVFESLTPDVGTPVLEALDRLLTGQIVAELDPARAAVLVARLEESTREDLLARLPAGLAKELKTLTNYPPEAAGGLMDPRVTVFRPETTVSEALARLRGLRRRGISDVFLADAEGRLVGSVALQDVAVSPPAERLERIARAVPAKVQAMASREEVVECLEKQRLTSLPVVDFEDRLLGVIRYHALVTAIEEEVSADIQTMVGVSKEERALSTIPFAVRKRLPWLEINLATAFLAAAVVGLFEGIIAKFTALAVLLPVVAGQSGNTGAQALAVTMRGLALREIRVRHWLRVTVKEATVGFTNGVVVALTTALAVYVWSGSTGLALVIGFSMVLSMVAAGLAGASIPIVLTAVGQDPAQSSSIILTTVTDVVGFFSFLGIATLLAAMI